MGDVPVKALARALRTIDMSGSPHDAVQDRGLLQVMRGVEDVATKMTQRGSPPNLRLRDAR